MQQRLYSVEEVAELLGLHVRTVRSYVRQGRLPAVKIGKQYRISAEDLAGLTRPGGPAAPVSGPPAAASTVPSCHATATVHVEGVTSRQADRLRTTLLGGLRSREGGRDLLRVECVHDERAQRTTVVVVGGTAATAELLRSVDALVEALEEETR